VDGNTLPSINSTHSQYPLDNNRIGFNYSQQAMHLDILVHGFDSATNKMFRIMKLKRVENNKRA